MRFYYVYTDLLFISKYSIAMIRVGAILLLSITCPGFYTDSWSFDQYFFAKYFPFFEDEARETGVFLLIYIYINYYYLFINSISVPAIKISLYNVNYQKLIMFIFN